MPGPTGSPTSRRAGRRGQGWDTLPAEGRTGPPPPWPMPPRADGREDRRAALWRELWSTPQAVSWERHRWTAPQARYVEMVLRVEDDLDGASVSYLGELRHVEAALLLTNVSLLRARTTIGEPGGATVTPLRGVVDLSDHATRAGTVTVDLNPHVDPDAPRPPAPAC